MEVREKLTCHDLHRKIIASIYLPFFTLGAILPANRAFLRKVLPKNSFSNLDANVETYAAFTL